MRGMVLVIVAVAGCSSAGGGGDVDRLAMAASLEAALAAENISDPAALPLRGTAGYAGFMTLGLPVEGTTRTYVGDLDLNVNFGARRDQVTGTVSDIAGAMGSLSISGGNLNRAADPDTDFTFDGIIDGTLHLGAQAFDIDGNLSGDFRGRNQDGVTGIVSGTINGANSEDIFDGTFAATRND